LPRDEELYYAQIAASNLAIPLVSQELGDFGLYERCTDPALRTAFPLVYPHLALHHETLERIGRSGARVLLSGHGADALMAPSATYYRNLVRDGRWMKFALEVCQHVRYSGSLAGMVLASAVWPGVREAPWASPIPDWINPAFAAKVNVQERWAAGWATYHGSVDACQQLRQPWLSRNFEAVEALEMPVVARYPFYDVRLVEFMLGLPNYLLLGKRILREAIRGKLPESVRTRPKTPLQGDPVRAFITDGKLVLSGMAANGTSYPEPLMRNEHLLALDRYCQGDGAESTWSTVLVLAPIALTNWLSEQPRTSP